MSRRAPFLGLALSALFLADCATDRTGGTSSETENVVMASEFRVDSILPAWNRPDSGATVATLRLDRQVMDFARTDSLGRDLRIQSPDGTDLPFEIVYWDKQARLGRLRVRIGSPPAMLSFRIRLSWGQAFAARADAQATWQGISLARRTAISSFVLDDFLDGDLASNLPSGAKWYSAASESTTVSIPVVGPDTLGIRGNGLNVAYSADSSKYRYVVVGLDLGPGARNLRCMDSLFLRVRGSGKLSLSLDNLTATEGKKAWIHHNLGPDWTELVVKPTDFLPPGSPTINVGWGGVRDSVTNLSFILSGGTEFHLDEVRIHGLDRDDFE